MSEQKHTPETLIIRGDEIGYISRELDQSHGMFCPVVLIYDEDYARHIVACVNACAVPADAAVESTKGGAK